MGWNRTRLVVAGTASVAVLVAVVQLGPRIPAIESLFGLPGSGALNYSGSPGGLRPLSEEFLANVLGRVPVGDSATRGPASSSGVQRPGRVSALPPGPRTTVTHSLTNDDFEDAYPVSSVPFTARTNAQAASRQSAEPRSCSTAARTVWYRYTPTTDIGLLANTFGTQRPTSVGAFTGDRLGSLSVIDCNSSTTGNAYVPLRAEAGKTYYFQVAETLGGTLRFNLDLLGSTTRVSVASDGRPSDDVSGFPSLSSDGRYVAFHSFASLTPDDDNICRGQPYLYGQPCPDVYVHDRTSGRTTLISTGSSGVQGNDISVVPSISGDGRFVSFLSYASNLVEDHNNAPDVFVRDRLTGITSRVSVDSAGREGKWPGPLRQVSPGEDPRGEGPLPIIYEAAVYALEGTSPISADGRYVAFTSRLAGLVPDDTNRDYDVFVHDRATGETSRVSVSSSGEEANKRSAVSDITPDGRYVAFFSLATNLARARHDPALCPCMQVYVHDRLTHRTRLVSLDARGEAGNDWSLDASISDDGRYVSFSSLASNLVDGDVPATQDVFVRDLVTGTTTSLTNNRGGPLEQDPDAYVILPTKDPIWYRTSISADGRHVAYATTASRSLGDDDNVRDVFVHDRFTGANIRVSVSSAAAPGNDASYNVAMSSDGTTVAFASRASNLVADDTQQCLGPLYPSGRSCADVFVHELPASF